MKLYADKAGNPRCYTARLGWKEHFDPKEIEMLAAGTVPMLIPPRAVQGKKNDVIEYDITPYTTLEFYLNCVLSREQFWKLLQQCDLLFRQMQAVYMDYKKLVLALDQIYVLLSDQSLHFIYLPLRECRREASIPAFLQSLAAHVGRSTYEQVTFLEALQAFLKQPQQFTLADFEAFLQQYAPAAAMAGGIAAPQASPRSAAPCAVYTPPTPAPGAFPVRPAAVYTPPVPAPAAPAMPRPAAPAPVSAPAAPMAAPAMPRPAAPAPVSAPAAPVSAPAMPRPAAPAQYAPAPQKAPEEEGTMLLEKGSGTVLLGNEPMQPAAVLHRVRSGEDIPVAQPMLRIGQDPAQTDYCVRDNGAVSHLHAVIGWHDEAYWITDNHSTNHTSVNGARIEPGQPVPLPDGAQVRLANEEFVFSLKG